MENIMTVSLVICMFCCTLSQYGIVIISTQFSILMRQQYLILLSR